MVRFRVTLACSRHFWHETQSITREILWNTPLVRGRVRG